MNEIFSPFTAHSEEEPSSWVGDALIAVLAVECCFYLAYFISEVL